MMRFHGQVALVTGGATGLGAAIAERLSREGAAVVVTDIQVDAGQAAAHANGYLFLEQDVRDEVRWLEIIHQIETRFGQVDILVNNAGIAGPMHTASPESTTLASWRAVFAVNLEAVFLGCRAVIPAMRRKGRGAIVNLSSVAAMTATPYASAYGASKAAVRQFTRSLAQYCAEEKLNIRCNSVHPGVVRTPLWEKYARESATVRGVTVERVLEEEQQEIPLGTFTTPEDVAAAVAFLVSEDARNITGSQLVVDGGYVDCDTYRGAARSP